MTVTDIAAERLLYEAWAKRLAQSGNGYDMPAWMDERGVWRYSEMGFKCWLGAKDPPVLDRRRTDRRANP